MEIVDVTWSRATLVWWSIFWRTTLVAMLAGAVIGLILGIVATATDSMELLESWAEVIGALLVVPAGIWAAKKVLTMEYRRFRVALLPSTEALLEQRLRDPSE